MPTPIFYSRSSRPSGCCGSYADKQAQRHGLTKAQWAVLAKLERTEGLKQAEVAELLDMQPITLTRLIDRLCDSGLIERRADPSRSPHQPPLSHAAAQPLLASSPRCAARSRAPRCTVSTQTAVHRLVAHLETVKNNIREALQARRGRLHPANQHE